MTKTTPAPGVGRIYTGHREAMTTRDWQALGWDAAAAGRYAAAFVGSAVRVFVVDEHGTRPLTHHVRHSPSGLAWGYGGSGAAELARCVLLDYYDISDDAAADEWESPLPVSCRGQSAAARSPTGQDRRTRPPDTRRPDRVAAPETEAGPLRPAKSDAPTA